MSRVVSFAGAATRAGGSELWVPLQLEGLGWQVPSLLLLDSPWTVSTAAAGRPKLFVLPLLMILGSL